MEYYDPIDHTSKRFAAVVSAVVMALIAVVICFARIDIHPLIVAEPPLEILLEEQEEVVEQRDMDHSPKLSEDVRNDYRPAHVEEARTEQSQQTSGEAEKTQTVNPNALFKPTTGNSAETLPEGNRLAPDGDRESHKGEGAGYNLQGSDLLDAGLRGRGLREALPRPTGSSQVAGTVVVAVVIGSDGNVISAEVRQAGTTTNDAELRRKAVEAARKAKFRPSDRMSQGGTITYVFNLK